MKSISIAICSHALILAAAVAVAVQAHAVDNSAVLRQSADRAAAAANLTPGGMHPYTPQPNSPYPSQQRPSPIEQPLRSFPIPSVWFGATGDVHMFRADGSYSRIYRNNGVAQTQQGRFNANEERIVLRVDHTVAKMPWSLKYERGPNGPVNVVELKVENQKIRLTHCFGCPI